MIRQVFSMINQDLEIPVGSTSTIRAASGLENRSIDCFKHQTKMEVAVVGSLMIDLITYVDNLPKVGETVFGTSFQTSFGGKGANQAVQCARLGIKVSMAGMIGKDMYGSDYRQQLIKEGVNVDALAVSDTKTSGTASIQVDSRGQNSIIIVQGANLDLLPAVVQSLEAMIEQASIVLCQNEIPVESTKEVLQLCAKHGTVSVLNPAPASATMIDLIPLCDIFCPNEVELASLSGLLASTDEEIQRAAEHLLSFGCKIVLVTLGSRGACLARAGECTFFIDVPYVQAVDTVGAGDSFIGSLASNLSRNVPIEEAVRRAIHCASNSVTKRGAQTSYPTRSEVELFAPPPAPVSRIYSKQQIRDTLRL